MNYRAHKMISRLRMFRKNDPYWRMGSSCKWLWVYYGQQHPYNRRFYWYFEDGM